MSYNDLRRNLDTYNDRDDDPANGTEYCENCDDWREGDDGKCTECGLNFEEQRAFLDNNTYEDMLDMLPL